MATLGHPTSLVANSTQATTAVLQDGRSVGGNGGYVTGISPMAKGKFLCGFQHLVLCCKIVV